LIYKVLQIYFF